MTSRITSAPLSRREFLGAGAALAAMPAWSSPPGAETAGRLPLRTPTIRLALLQTEPPELPQRDIASARLRTAKSLQQRIDRVIERSGAPHWLALPEFALTGWGPFTADGLRRAAIDVPGRETERLAAAARRHGIYLSFGAWVHDPDWPRKVIPMTLFIDPQGEVVAQHWQRVGPAASAHAITIEDVESQYRERYGADALTPVLRTEIGNLAAPSGTVDPARYGGLVDAGAELIVLTNSGAPRDRGGQLADACRRHRMFSGIVGTALEALDPGAPPSPHAGGSAIVGPDGVTLAAATTPGEACVIAELPLGAWRAGQRAGAGFCSRA